MQDETLNGWKKQTKLTDCLIRLDPLRHHLQICNTADTKEDHFLCDEVIELHNMSDVRNKIYTSDETKDPGDWLVGPTELDRFFMIPYYPDGNMDYISVSFLNFICPTPKAATDWRTGLAALIAYNTQWCTRFVSYHEKLARMYSRMIAIANPFSTSTGAVPPNPPLVPPAPAPAPAPAQPTTLGQLNPRPHPPTTLVSGSIDIKAVRDMFGKAKRDDMLTALKEMKLMNAKVKNTINATLMTAEAFESLANKIAPFSGVNAAFQKIASKGVMDGFITAGRLLKLLTEEHRDQRANEILEPCPTELTVAEMLEAYEPLESNRDSEMFSMEGFQQFLLSQEGEALNPDHMTGTGDMSKPLSHYFISSSHNSYLLGGQIKSKSCAEVYRQIVLGGCRCVELDAWDGADGIPIITHGNTMCSTFPFADAIQAIMDVAWVRSEMPMILSFENHCSLPQQQKMLDAVLAIFKDDLSSVFMAGDGPDFLPKNLPSPDSLKRKIIIKNKRCAEDQLSKTDENTRASEMLDPESILVDGEMVTETEDEVRERKERSGVILPELSAVVNYVWPISFKGFDKALSVNCSYHMSSFNEKKAARCVAGQPEEFVDYCKRQVARIYPMVRCSFFGTEICSRMLYRVAHLLWLEVSRHLIQSHAFRLSTLLPVSSSISLQH
jgi:hypothetical protein